jgi:uncharacterized membrane protein
MSVRLRNTVVALLVLSAAYGATIWVFPWSDERVNDMWLMRSNATAFLDGQLPYRDVFFEYPPLAAVPIALPALNGTDPRNYRRGLIGLSFVLAVAVLLLVRELARRSGGSETLAMLGVAVSPLLLGATLRNHFDLAPVAVTLLALLLLVSGRALLGMAMLGVAVAIKGYPLVIAPVALAWLLGRGMRREAIRGGAAFAAVVALAFAAMVAISPSGARDAIRWHTDRPVQIESTPAAILNLTGADTIDSNEFRSHGIEHPAAGAISGVFTALGVLAVALLAFGASRSPQPRALLTAALAATAAYAAFGKVLSPQYLVWTVPWMALALSWRQFAVAGTLAAATVLTFFEFPLRYGDLIAREPLTVAAVALRDALLIVAVALAVAALGVRRRQPAPA